MNNTGEMNENHNKDKNKMTNDNNQVIIEIIEIKNNNWDIIWEI